MVYEFKRGKKTILVYGISSKSFAKALVSRKFPPKRKKKK